jgi:hypothetical protein
MIGTSFQQYEMAAPVGVKGLGEMFLAHLTHRCRNRQFLFKFARDREQDRQLLGSSLREVSSSPTQPLVRMPGCRARSRFCRLAKRLRSKSDPAKIACKPLWSSL